MREVIAAVPDGLARPGSTFSTVSMLEEGLSNYLSFEQDPYWAAEELARYLAQEKIPVPRHIVEEMLMIAATSPASCGKIKRLLCFNDPDLPLEKYIECLVPLAEASD